MAKYYMAITCPIANTTGSHILEFLESDETSIQEYRERQDLEILYEGSNKTEAERAVQGMRRLKDIVDEIVK
ncbi:MAG: hypothetical protein ABIF88_02970 [archaeon]